MRSIKVIRNPAQSLADCIAKIADRLLDDKDFNEWGIYHYCGFDAVTGNQFAKVIFDHAIKMNAIPHEVSVVPISSQEFKSKAKRPFDSRLSCEKIKEVFAIEPPLWEADLPAIIESYQRERQGLTPLLITTTISFQRYCSNLP